MTDSSHGSRPMCGHKYCPPERCGYMPDRDRMIVASHGEGLGTGLPNDVDFAPIDLRILKFLQKEKNMSASIGQQTKDHSQHTSGAMYTNVKLTSCSTDEDNTEVTVLGFAEVDTCDDCPHLVIRCLHETRSWQHRPDCTEPPPDGGCSGCLLKCHFCGADLT